MKFQVAHLPPFLRAMSQALKAGQSFEQALEFITPETRPPLRTDLEKLLQDLHFSLPLKTAFQNWTHKRPLPEIQLFTQSTLLQRQTGGNLTLLFERIAKIIEERLALKRDLKTFTAQGRLSGMLIAGLWPVSLLLFYKLSPAHLDLLLHTSAGHFMLELSIFLEMLGGLWIWKIIHPKVL